MAAKRILIVDDEDAILTVLKGSLKKMAADYDVATASSGPQALALLEHGPFDLVVTDYRMAGMDGLELLGRIRALRPEVRVILMTAYGNSALEAESKRLEAYRYLTKPLDLDTFRQVVREAVAETPPDGSRLLILTEQRYRWVNERLAQLQVEVGARCALLTDCEGRFIARTAAAEELPLLEVAALLGGCTATLTEAGRLIDGDENTINLAYREGAQDSLYAVNIGNQLLLTLLVERGPHSARLGSAWFAARKAAMELQQSLSDPEHGDADQIFGRGVKEAIDQELRNVLRGLGAGPRDSAAQDPLPARGAISPPASDGEQHQDEDIELLDFEAAVRAGIVTGRLRPRLAGKTREERAL